MATIRKRGDRWQVQVRLEGYPHVSRSFRIRSDAVAWARQIEAEADRQALPVDPRTLDRLTVADVIRRYRDTIVPTKRSHEFEAIILNAFLQTKLARLTLAKATPAQFAAYRDERLKTVKPATLNRQLGILRHAFHVAKREWNIPLRENPVAAIRKPEPDKARDRRLETGEWELRR